MNISYILIGCCIAAMFVCGHAQQPECVDPIFPNGVFIYSTDNPSIQEATLSCNNGYKLAGDNKIACQGNGVWSGSYTCITDCGDPILPNGAFIYSQGNPSTQIATLSCNGGYKLAGPSTITCLVTGIWSESSSCNPVHAVCGDLIIANGVFSATQGNTQGNTQEATYTLSCNIGYEVDGDDTTTCQASGFWAGAGTFSCKAVECTLLPTPPANGAVVSDFGAIAEYMDAATYSCMPGFTLHGATTIHCQADGTWNAPKPFCGNDACPSLSNPINGEVSFASSTPNLETVSYSCKIGYNLVGASSQSCSLADGVWIGIAPVCQIQDPVEPGKAKVDQIGKFVLPDGESLTVNPLTANENANGKLAPNGKAIGTFATNWNSLSVKPCQHQCCVQGEMNIGLGSLYDDVIGSLDGVTVLQTPMSQSGANTYKPCSKTALLKVNFEKITKEYCGEFCLENPYCGRRMLKIEMDLSADERSSWMFNVGDSISNNGWKGDSGHQSNDAETDGRYPNVAVWSSEVSKQHQSLLAVFFNAIGPIVDHVTLYVSNEHIRITNNAGLDKSVCHRWLYALNGHPDIGPINTGPNEDIYIGLNRVVNGLISRNGVGLCSATLTWTCPWN